MNPSLLRTAVVAVAVLVAGLTVPVSALGSPTLHGVAPAASSFEASLAIARPTGALPGDLMIAVVDARLPMSASITPPSGWNLVRRDATPSGMSSSLSQAIYYRVRGALELTSYTWGFQRKTGAAGALLAYGGVDVGAPIAGHAGRTQSDVKAIVAPSVAATHAGDGLLAFFGTAGAHTIAPPPTMTERHEVSLL